MVYWPGCACVRAARAKRAAREKAMLLVFVKGKRRKRVGKDAQKQTKVRIETCICNASVIQRDSSR